MIQSNNLAINASRCFQTPYKAHVRHAVLRCDVLGLFFIWITLKRCFNLIITNDCKSPGTFSAIQIKIYTCKPTDSVTNIFLSYDAISGKSTYLFGSSKIYSKISSFTEKLKHLKHILKPHTSHKERHVKMIPFTIGIYVKTYSHV